MLHLLRKLIPRPFLAAYHFLLAYVAAVAYGFPSRRLTVIGVTGTYGKSSVVMLLGYVLRTAGYRVGWVSTATISDGEREWLNAMKMTMPGRLFLQRFLRRLVASGCTHAIIETSSQGIAQDRHRGIANDIAVLTNLHPEHLEAHGGFIAYRAAKARFFTRTARGSKPQRIAIIPADLERPEEFVGYPFTRVVAFRTEDARELALAPALAAFPENITAVLAVCEVLGIDRSATARALGTIRGLPGRLEEIDCGQPFDVVVDYAFTPDAFRAVYRAFRPIEGRTIHVLGGTGGGRDAWKLPILGETAAQHANIVIVTNEDPYDDDPLELIRSVAGGARQWAAEQGSGTLIEEVPDRRDAIARAIALARPGDRIFVTGKGCEQAIIGPRGKKTPWDDRIVLRELLKQHGFCQSVQSTAR